MPLLLRGLVHLFFVKRSSPSDFHSWSFMRSHYICVTGQYVNWCEAENYQGKNKCFHEKTLSPSYIYLDFRCSPSFGWQLSFCLCHLPEWMNLLYFCFLYHLHNILSTILNVSLHLLPFKTPALVHWNLQQFPSFASKLQEALWNFCWFEYSTASQWRDRIVT